MSKFPSLLRCILVDDVPRMNATARELMHEIADGELRRLHDLADMLEKSGDVASANKARRIGDWQLGRADILELLVGLLSRSQLIAFRNALSTCGRDYPTSIEISDSQFEIVEGVVGSVREFVIMLSTAARQSAPKPELELQRQLRILARLLSEKTEP